MVTGIDNSSRSKISSWRRLTHKLTGCSSKRTEADETFLSSSPSCSPFLSKSKNVHNPDPCTRTTALTRSVWNRSQGKENGQGTESWHGASSRPRNSSREASPHLRERGFGDRSEFSTLSAITPVPDALWHSKLRLPAEKTTRERETNTDASDAVSEHMYLQLQSSYSRALRANSELHGSAPSCAVTCAKSNAVARAPRTNCTGSARSRV